MFEIIEGTDVQERDSRGDIGGYIEYAVDGVQVAYLLVDNDPLRLQIVGAEWDRSEPSRPTVAPETFLAWLDGPTAEGFALDEETVARLDGDWLTFPKAGTLVPRERLATFREGFRTSLAHAARWRRDGWLEAEPLG